MSTSDRESMVNLKVNVADAGTEVFVSNSQLLLIGRGVGGYSGMLPPGIYQVRLRASFATFDDIVVLSPEQTEVTKSYKPLSFASPVPLGESLQETDLAACAAQRCQTVTRSFGEGASVFIFSRSAPGQTEHPLKGLRLLNAEREPVGDLLEDSELVGTPVPRAASCTLDVVPGNYLICQDRSEDALFQSLMVCLGWQTQVFLQWDRIEGEDTLNLSDAAVMYAPRRTFDSTDRETRLSELARLGLANHRQAISKEVLTEILHGNFECPMLGLFGAHLALELSPVDAVQQLSGAVKRLRELLPSHPDVESLSLLLGESDGVYEFDWPPMLMRSWGIVIRESGSRQRLIRPGGLADRIATKLWGRDPWLQWREPIRTSLDVHGISDFVGIRKLKHGGRMGRRGLGERELGRSVNLFADDTQAMYEDALKAHLRAMFASLKRRMERGKGELFSLPATLNESQLRQLTVALCLPDRHVKEMLAKMGIEVSCPSRVPIEPV